MNRKNFISSIFPAAALSMQPQVLVAADDPAMNNIIPPYLKKGDTIGITSPAGFITTDEIQPAVQKLKEWGFSVQTGSSIGKRDFTFGGTDKERLNDLQQMLDDKRIKAILCARGGYGAVRIIDSIDFTKFIQHPKWIIGFSDITVLHAHVNRNTGIATLHSKMCNSFPVEWSSAEQIQKDSIESIRKCISGELMQYEAMPNAANKKGAATGILIGGNLKTIESLAGTKSDLHTAGKILFVEDAGEYLYSIDRMFWNLKRSGKLDNLKGLIVGGFKIKKDDEGEEFGKTLEAIVLEKIKTYAYPVCFDFPVGHQKNNIALKCGCRHTLTVTDSGCTLKELR